ncbi:MAG: acyltransferase [Deltaproteobacteria bacterium]|nr:MAG: acyltransferase [Deltaproteobacteria bacterium]
MPAQRLQIFAPLTRLRAFAAYLVFRHHYPQFATSSIDYRLGREGYVGVSIFFVLSGFLLQHRSGESIQLNKEIFRSYLRGRFARIYPLYFIVCIASMHISAEYNRFIWLLNLALLKGFSDKWKFSYLSQSWSLTVEECFYGLFPFFTWAMVRKRLSFVKLMTLCYAIGLLLWALGNSVRWEGFFAAFQFVSSFTFFGRGFQFLIGMQGARLASRLLSKESTLFHLTSLGAVTSMLAYGLLVMLAPAGSYAIRTPVGLIVHHWVFAVGVALLVTGLAYERTSLSRILGSPLAVFAGKSSYAFYLLYINWPGMYLASQSSRARCWLNFFLVSSLFFYFWKIR